MSALRSNVTIIVAMGINRAIGKDNKLLWELPEDMKLFKQNTIGRTVVMGRRTAESIGRALPKRRNLVLTSQPTAPYEGQEVVRSLEEAIALTQGEELCVIGGAQVYAAAVPLADCVKVSLVMDQPKDADTFFPPIDLIKGWRLRTRKDFAGSDFSPPFSYMEYIRDV